MQIQKLNSNVSMSPTLLKGSCTWIFVNKKFMNKSQYWLWLYVSYELNCNMFFHCSLSNNCSVKACWRSMVLARHDQNNMYIYIWKKCARHPDSCAKGSVEIWCKRQKRMKEEERCKIWTRWLALNYLDRLLWLSKMIASTDWRLFPSQIINRQLAQLKRNPVLKRTYDAVNAIYFLFM